jgi:predicted membrane metal-binding protein
MRVSLVSRIRAALGVGVGILFYTLLVGEGMGIVRAALMALANPNALWDVSFQLSFAAALGLVLYALPL